MNVYCVMIDVVDEFNASTDILGVFSSRELANEAIMAFCNRNLDKELSMGTDGLWVSNSDGNHVCLWVSEQPIIDNEESFELVCES